MNKWSLAYKEHDGDFLDLSGLTEIIAPEGLYYADPFLLERDGKTYVFFEEYDYKKGRICYSDIEEWSPEPAIEEDHHLSFPSVFEYEGRLFMIPEALDTHAIPLYECVGNLNNWVFVKYLFQGGAFADPVFHKDETGCYIYTTANDDNKLWILRSDSLFGEWTLFGEHYDKDGARSAGHLFDWGGILVRPTQDSRKGYGSAVSLRNAETFKEIKRIEPTWAPDLIGTHTFNMTDQFLIIDGKRHI